MTNLTTTGPDVSSDRPALPPPLGTPAVGRGGYAPEELRDRVARVKRQHPLLPTLMVEGVDMRPAGGRKWRALCPLHREKTPSFYVWVYADPEEDHYKCFGCGERGDLLDFYQQTRGLTFGQVMELLEGRPAPPPPPPALVHAAAALADPEERCWERAGFEEQRVMNIAGAHYHGQLLGHPEGLGYLRQRRIPQWLITDRRLGFSDGNGLFDALGTDRRRVVAVELGLFQLADHFRALLTSRDAPIPHGTGPGRIPRSAWFETMGGRIVVPELRGKGRHPIWFTGRKIDGHPALRAGKAKYLNLKGERPVLGRDLVEAEPEVAACESVADWLTALANQLPAFCTLGTDLTRDELGFLASAETVYGVFHTDEAGRRALARFGEVFGAVFRPVPLPEGLDLNELFCRRGGRARIRALFDSARLGAGVAGDEDGATGGS